MYKEFAKLSALYRDLRYSGILSADTFAIFHRDLYHKWSIERSK